MLQRLIRRAERIPGIEHQDGLYNVGAMRVSSLFDHYSCIHQELSPKEWKAIPKAVDAVNKAYDQMDAIKTWDYDSVPSIVNFALAPNRLERHFILEESSRWPTSSTLN